MIIAAFTWENADQRWNGDNEAELTLAKLARVIVNRVWKHHFRAGIVETPSDFGAQGARPSATSIYPVRRTSLGMSAGIYAPGLAIPDPTKQVPHRRQDQAAR